MKNRILAVVGMVLMSMMMVSGAYAEPNFQVMIHDSIFGIVGAGICGNAYSISATVKNVGTHGTMRVEAGIYETAQVAQWYPSLVTPIVNCKQYETNVATKDVTLDAGEFELIHFEVIVPSSAYLGWYTVHVNAFKNCWTSQTPLTGQTGYDTALMSIVCGSPVQTCMDGIMNQGETDTDCGGSNCGGCGLYGHCKVNRDCETGLYCSAGKCASVVGPGPGPGVGCAEQFKNNPVGMLGCYFAQNRKTLNALALILVVGLVALVVIPRLK